MESITRSLNAIWVVAKQEFELFTVSPIVYFVSAVWLFFAGLFFAVSLVGFNTGFGEPSMNGVLNSMIFLMVFLAPAFTMRSLSDEIRSGTYELLITSPIREWEVVVGKWVGVMGVFLFFVFIPMLIYPAILLWRGNPDEALMISGFISLFLTSGTMFAIGLLASSFTQYQIVAYLISLVVGVFMLVADGVSSIVNSEFVVEVMRDVSLRDHYIALVNRSLVDPVDLAYFIGVIVIALFLASQVLTTRRISA